MPFTPLPNDFIDQVMPTLKDTEWRLLCVIARQTIGWRSEKGGRKERDWLTQNQLKARTGRDSAALSDAVAALVARRLIMVSDVTGKSLVTVKARRSTRSRVYYGLHPDLLSAIVPKSEVVASDQTVKSPHFSEMDSRFSSHEARKANGTKENETKETLTKEIVTEVFFENRIGQMPQTTLDLDTETAEPSSPELVRFIEHYRQRFREQIGDTPPPASRDDMQRLQALLDTGSFEDLAGLLDIFFTIGFAYIRRQGYPLSAFVHSVNILQAMKPKNGDAGGFNRTGTWHPAGAILPEHLPEGAHE